MNPVHFQHWTDAHRAALREAQSLKDLLHIALAVTETMPPEIHMVSGPLSTGGVGNPTDNWAIFGGVIESLIIKDGLNIFSQMPLEDKFRGFYRRWRAENPHEEYCNPILEEFYEPLFSSGRVAALHFIHGWDSSRGAKWEHGHCDRWRIERIYLPEELSRQILADIRSASFVQTG